VLFAVPTSVSGHIMNEGLVTDRRPSKEEYYLSIAKEVALRGTCLRRNFGAVIINNDQIISTGYTGAPRGTQNCIDVGHCYREQHNVPSGERYELCRSVHAEMNSVIHAARSEMVGGSLFLTGIEAKTGELVEDAEPCKLCKRVIINAGIKYVYVMMNGGQVRRMLVSDWVANESGEFYADTKGY